jgi:hypothetical protein
MPTACRECAAIELEYRKAIRLAMTVFSESGQLPVCP